MDLKKIDLDKLQDYAFTADEIAIRKAAISNSKFINIKCLDNESLIPTVKAIPIAKVEQAREEIDRYIPKYKGPKWARTTFVDIRDVLRILDKLIAESET